jgi:hypothetical protein
MARTTKLAEGLTSEVGQSASRIQGWKDNGYWPAVPVSHAELVLYLRELAPLTGPGRDGDVAVIRMADAGRPLVRLRTVLLSLQELDSGQEDTQDPDELVEGAITHPDFAPWMHELQERAKSLGPPREWSDFGNVPDEPALPEVILRSAMLGMADELVGEEEEESEPENFADLARLGDASLARLGLQVEWRSDDPVMLAIEQASMQRAVAIARSAHGWLTTAEPQELAKGVQAARLILEAMGLVGMPTLPDSEGRWRMIGRFAATALANIQMMLIMFQRLGTLLPSDADEPEISRLFRQSIQEGARDIGVN